MTNPKVELREYLNKLIHRYLFIRELNDELKTMLHWVERPYGINALEEAASFFNLVQRGFNQTLLIELCKFISDDEEKSLRKFLDLAKSNAKSIEPTEFNTDKWKRKIIHPMKYYGIIQKHLAHLANHTSVIDNLKSRRDKALAHTDASFFNNPNKHYKTYPLMSEDIDQLLETVEEILKEQALYLLESDYDFKLYTNSGVDRVLEFMRAYFTIIHEDSKSLKYRWDDYYDKKEKAD